jgi:NADH-quinone oxidoreductase subunit M
MNLFLHPGILALLIVALVILLKSSSRSRTVAVVAAGLSALCFVILPSGEGVAHQPSVTFSLLACAALLLLPRQDATPATLAGLLFGTASTHLCYSAPSLPWLALGWWLTLLPSFLGMFGRHKGQGLAHGFFILSAICMTLGAFLPNISVGCLLAAVVLRKGVFPLQAGSLAKFEHGSLIPSAMLFNGHLGAIVILKMAPHPAQEWLGIAALISAVLLATRTFVERKPRRILALISLSQASFILAGLTLHSDLGRSSAMLHWMVVSISSVGLAAIIRAIEVRVAGAVDPQDHLGLGLKTPRLAAFFLLCALALIGLPGTLGYIAEDLLFHGTLEEHPLMGLALPIATAFNAIHLLRLYGILFLGVLPKHLPEVTDALPRERWPLTIACCFLILAGLAPRLVLPTSSKTDPGHAVASAHER